MENESKKSGIYVSKGLLIFIIIAFIGCIGIIVYQNFIKTDKMIDITQPEITASEEIKNSVTASEQSVNENSIINSEKTSNKGENAKKIDQTKELIYNTSYSMSYNDEFGVHTYDVPYINIDSENVKKINNDIENKYKELVNSIEKDNVEPGKIEYQYYINGNVLSLVIIRYYSNDCTYHEVYNIDIAKGTEITNEELLKIKNISKEAYLSKLKELYKKEFTTKYGGTQEESFYIEQLERTISPDNYSISTPIFLDRSGVLNVVATIYSLAGADSYEHIIKVNL